LAVCQALLMSEAEQVTAIAIRQGFGEPQALLLTVQYRHGPILQCAASLAENARDELVLVTHDRPLTLAGSPSGSRLRIASSGQGAHCEREFLLPDADPVVAEAGLFIE